MDIRPHRVEGPRNPRVGVLNGGAARDIERGAVGLGQTVDIDPFAAEMAIGSVGKVRENWRHEMILWGCS